MSSPALLALIKRAEKSPEPKVTVNTQPPDSKQLAQKIVGEVKENSKFPESVMNIKYIDEISQEILVEALFKNISNAVEKGLWLINFMIIKLLLTYFTKSELDFSERHVQLNKWKLLNF